VKSTKGSIHVVEFVDYIQRVEDGTDTTSRFAAIMQLDTNGKDLATYIQRNSPITMLTLTSILIKLVEALQEVHALGIIHKVQYNQLLTFLGH
jgi:serine/threonine protein kinase